jgi:inhibitor of KinA sporulation pathway (predicted exonuclease)
MGGKRGSQLLHIVFDLEATCWRKGSTPDRMEIIEIGATKLSKESYDIESVFSTFVKPIKEVELSDFCKELTSIKQSDVDSAPEFPQAVSEFFKWIDEDQVTFCSWGAYDIKQIRIDYRRHRLPEPESLDNHINLKKLFSELYDRKPCGMKKALNILGLDLEGTHHRGVDDAKNISKIAKVILPKYYDIGD